MKHLAEVREVDCCFASKIKIKQSITFVALENFLNLVFLTLKVLELLSGALSIICDLLIQMVISTLCVNVTFYSFSIKQLFSQNAKIPLFHFDG